MKFLFLVTTFLSICGGESLLFPLINIASVAEAAPLRKAKSVRGMYAEGESFFLKGKYKAATEVFSKILRKYPDHVPTKILYARSAFKLGKHGDALGLFKQVDLKALDPESSYEYGQVFYKSKSWAVALEAFARVSKKHAFYDLASYYSGKSAFKLKKYRLALKKFQQAIVLPDNLAKSRQTYVKHLNEYVKNKEEKKLKKALTDEESGKIKKPKKKRKIKVIKVEESKPYTHSGRFNIGRSAKVMAAQSLKKSEYHGHKEVDTITTKTSFSFATGALYTFEKPRWKKGERAIAVGIPLSASYLVKDQTGEESTTIVYAEDESFTEWQVVPLDFTHVKIGSLSAAPWVEIPIEKDWWLGFKAGYDFNFFDLESANRSGSRFARANIGADLFGHSVDVGIRYQDVISSDSELISSMLKNSVSYAYGFAHGFNLSLEGAVTSYGYVDDLSSGPDSVVDLGGKLSKSLPLGISLGGKGAYSIISGHGEVGLTEEGILSVANGNKVALAAYLSFRPFSWISVYVEQSASAMEWSSHDPDGDQALLAWQENMVDRTNQTSWSIQLQQKF